MEYSKDFQNELGRSIRVEVKEGWENSHPELCQEPYKVIDIRIIGPDSESQNTITVREAEELHKALSEVLQHVSSTK